MTLVETLSVIGAVQSIYRGGDSLARARDSFTWAVKRHFLLSFDWILCLISFRIIYILYHNFSLEDALRDCGLVLLLNFVGGFFLRLRLLILLFSIFRPFEAFWRLQVSHSIFFIRISAAATNKFVVEPLTNLFNLLGLGLEMPDCCV